MAAFAEEIVDPDIVLSPKTFVASQGDVYIGLENNMYNQLHSYGPICKYTVIKLCMFPKKNHF